MKKLRRSMLFCPANNNKMLMTAHFKKPDCIIFDLEDAVVYSEKENARYMLCEAIQKVDYGNCEIFARINSLKTEFGQQDVEQLVKSGIKNIRLPMCECKENVRELADMLTHYERKYGVENGYIKIQGAIETPKGVLNALNIATASDRMISISFGAEDYTNYLGINRMNTSMEFLYARSHIAICANVAGIDSIDTVYSDIKDIEGFIRETTEAKNLGFKGKSCIHPSQIQEIHKIYFPSEEEIKNAINIINSSKLGEEKGKGVISLDGKMIDKPILEKAKRILLMAKGRGLV